MSEAAVVVVTGASGLLGHHLVERLRTGHEVVGLDLRREELTFVEVDVTDEAALAEALDEVRATHGSRLASVVHLIAYYDFTGADSPKYDEVTVEGTRHLLRLLGDGFEVDQFVFSSTMLVHAPVAPGQVITEDSPLQGGWAYPDSKIATEAVVAELAGDIPTVILRIAGAYDEEGHSPPLADQIRRISEGQLASHVYPGPLDRGQDFVHLDDVIDAFARVVDRRSELPSGTVLLIGEGRTYGYGEVQDAIGEALGHDGWPTIRVPRLPAKLGAAVIDRLSDEEGSLVKPFFVDQAHDHYALDVSRARRLLGWQPHHHLLEELPTMVRRLQTDPEAWYRENGLVDDG